MGIFSKPKSSVSKEFIVTDICSDLAKTTMVFVDEGLITIDKSSEFWAIIVSVGELTLAIEDQISRFHLHLESDTSKFDPNQKKAFENRSKVPFFDILYRGLREKSVKDGTNIINSIRDLTNTLNRLSHEERESNTYELSKPLFEHYLHEAAVIAKDDSDEFLVFAMLLSMPFSSITNYLFKSKNLYSEENWILQFDLLSFIMSQIIVRWGELKFVNNFNPSPK